MQLKNRPYILLLFTSGLIFLVGLFCFNAALDIHIYDTYYVFPLNYFVWTPSIILLIFWLLYLLTKNILYSNILTWTHVIFTIIGCIFILITPYLLTDAYEGLAGMPRRYYDIGQSKTYQFIGKLTKSAIVFAFILIAGQLTYLVNLTIGINRRVSRQNNR